MASKSFVSHILKAFRASCIAIIVSVAYLGTASASEVESVLRATPYFKHGEHYGFRLYPKSDSDLEAFESLGFEPGDLLVKVDGQKLSNPPAPTEMYERLDRGEAVLVTVNRNDKLVEFSIQSP